MKIQSQKLIERYSKIYEILCPHCMNGGACSTEEGEDIHYAVWCELFEADNDEFEKRIQIKKNGCKWVLKEEKKA